MAICRHFGNPDLFITFTCNAKWPEIIEDMRDKPGCRAEDRPDIVSRIFRAKLNHMIKFIKSGKPFGDVEPYEAVWRLLQFHIHFREPSVERLSVHLPFDQNVVFREIDDLNYVINNPNLERTMLTQWFETNVQDSDARKLSYVEFPTKYVWKNDRKQWSRRKQGRSLGRVAYVHPATGELYYLRLLLNYQKGSFSFDHLKTVKDVLEPTFQAACTSLGLLGDDREWNNAMLEAVITASSFQLRQLFVTSVLFCNVADPLTLFEAHWKSMCDDISRNMLNVFGLQDVSKYQDELRNSLLYELEK
ncbi:hypothetical protein C1H46_022843 [Malus baccata]|uniref:Helitron helicase-like domain-containing protein n=1 Tax=Malus baccata TaxID=106549 RepID=A0A540LYP2_MALBA|nr:hypothetical protein C1H46_022843 [Malus baccata]